MDGHMNNEEVHSHSEAVLHELRKTYSLEQVRRLCTNIVRRIGSLKAAKDADAQKVDVSE